MSVPRRTDAGFTLIELIAALAVLAVIGGLLGAALAGARRAEDSGRTRADRTALERALRRHMETRLEAAWTSGGGAFDAGFTGEDSEKSPDMESIGDLPADRASFPSVINDPARGGFGEGDLALVEWEVVRHDEETGASGLVEVLNRVPTAQFVDDVETAWLIAPEVCGLNIRYFDGSSWDDVWDTEASEALPQAVEVTLVLLPPGMDPYGAAADDAIATGDGLERLTFVVRPPMGGEFEDPHNPDEVSGEINR